MVEFEDFASNLSEFARLFNTASSRTQRFLTINLATGFAGNLHEVVRVHFSALVQLMRVSLNEDGVILTPSSLTEQGFLKLLVIKKRTLSVFRFLVYRFLQVPTFLPTLFHVVAADVSSHEWLLLGHRCTTILADLNRLLCIHCM